MFTIWKLKATTILAFVVALLCTIAVTVYAILRALSLNPGRP